MRHLCHGHGKKVTLFKKRILTRTGTCGKLIPIIWATPWVVFGYVTILFINWALLSPIKFFPRHLLDRIQCFLSLDSDFVNAYISPYPYPRLTIFSCEFGIVLWEAVITLASPIPNTQWFSYVLVCSSVAVLWQWTKATWEKRGLFDPSRSQSTGEGSQPRPEAEIIQRTLLAGLFPSSHPTTLFI